MENKEIFTEANRNAWNMAMPHHRKCKDREWDTHFADPSFIIQKEPELTLLNKIDLSGKAVAHLCCNNGIELLSLKRLGAGKCVGFDICDEAITDAKKRAKQFDIPVEFCRTSVYDISHDYNNTFDIVYITIGAMTWLPDLQAFFAIVSRLLRKGGTVLIYESHPFTIVLPWDVSPTEHRVELIDSYFHDSYVSYKESLDYYGNATYDAPVTYEFLHTFTDIFNAVLSNKLVITSFCEYEHDISNGLAWVKQQNLRLPLSYTLTATKQYTN